MGKVTRDQINSLSRRVATSIVDDDNSRTVSLLKEVLDTKCSFSLLDLLGREMGRSGVRYGSKSLLLFDEIIEYDAMGSYVIVGQALIPFLPTDFDRVMKKSREYTMKGDRWYVCDIIAERSVGHALVNHFDQTLPWLKRFLSDENKWVQRSAGTAIHFFSKRVRNDRGKIKILLRLVEPHIEERQKDVVKGIGWGLKTIGKHHPNILLEFLTRQLKARKRISKSMMKKATAYLSKEQKARIEEYV